MAKERIDYTKHYDKVIDAMTSRGLLLGSYDAGGKPNVMTIGWGAMGSIWGVPVWTVLVRPSRYTFRCIEHTGCFTVNVPGESLARVCASAGSRSGANVDKFEELGITAEKASGVLAPVVAECPVHYECQVVHSNDILPQKLSDEILSGAYQDGDFHRVYWGKILGAYAESGAADLLGGR
ncbi:MAG: flavin reductase family protein [Phycisphaerae bacterium]